MIKIINEKLTFPTFYKRLCDSLDKNGELTNVVVLNCVITEIPQNYKIFVYSVAIKILGFTVHETDGSFCGFKCNSVHVEGCTFKAV